MYKRMHDNEILDCLVWDAHDLVTFPKREAMIRRISAYLRDTYLLP